MKGFTLLEIVVTMALSLLIFAAFARVYESFSTLYYYEGAAHNAQIAAGTVIRAAEADMLPADRILSTHTFSTGTYGSSSTTLAVEIPSVDSSGNLLTGDYDYAAIYPSSDAVYEIIDVNNASARRSGTFELAGSVSNLTFTYDNSDVTQAHQVTVSVTATSGGGKSATSMTLAETIRGRNLNP